jgi:hypothetical protein
MDAVTWTTIDRLFPIAIAYGGDKFIAAMSSNVVAYSTDAVTWTMIEQDVFNSSTTIGDITYGGGKFIATGNKGKIAYSNDQE